MSTGRDQVKEIMHDTKIYDPIKAAQNGPGSPDIVIPGAPDVYFETVYGLSVFPGGTVFSIIGAPNLANNFQVLYDIYYDVNLVQIIKPRAVQPTGTFPYSPKTIAPNGYAYIGTVVIDNTSGANFVPGVTALDAVGISFLFIG